MAIAMATTTKRRENMLMFETQWFELTTPSCCSRWTSYRVVFRWRGGPREAVSGALLLSAPIIATSLAIKKTAQRQ